MWGISTYLRLNIHSKQSWSYANNRSEKLPLFGGLPSHLSGGETLLESDCFERVWPQSRIELLEVLQSESQVAESREIIQRYNLENTRMRKKSGHAHHHAMVYIQCDQYSTKWKPAASTKGTVKPRSVYTSPLPWSLLQGTLFCLECRIIEARI